MITVTVQIGNTDDRLSQKVWAAYVREVDRAIQPYAKAVHFFGGSLPFEDWQNCCWVFESRDSADELKKWLKKVLEKYGQSSLAWTEGKTRML